MAYLNGYTKRRLLVVDYTKVDSDESNFPVMVDLTSFTSWDWNELNNDGFDIRFTQYDGTTLLKYEREQHIDNSKGIYWVKIPQIKSTSGQDANKFYIYYRTTDTADGADTVNVWDSGHKAVWHLRENGSPYLDSTVNDYDSSAGTYPTQGDSKIGKGQVFNNAASEYITYDTFAAGTFVENATLSFWARWDGRGRFPVRFSSVQNPDDWFAFGSSTYTTVFLNSRVNFVTSLATATYYHITITTEPGAGNWKFYKDGAVLNTQDAVTDQGGLDTYALEMGRIYFSDYFGGTLDEVRVSNVTRSAAWAKADYNSGNDTLLTYGDEEVFFSSSSSSFSSSSSSSSFSSSSSSSSFSSSSSSSSFSSSSSSSSFSSSSSSSSFSSSSSSFSSSSSSSSFSSSSSSSSFSSSLSSFSSSSSSSSFSFSSSSSSFSSSSGAVGTNMKIDVGDSWKDVDSMKIDIGDLWKNVVGIKEKVSGVWKDVF